MKSIKLLTVVEKVISLAKKDSFKDGFRMSKKDFTRNRKFSFFDNVMLILQCGKCSLQSSIDMYLNTRKEYNMEYSKQAFSKGRRRIKAEAFKALMDASVQGFYEDKRYNTFNGYLLLSIDGSDYNLPNTPDLLETFGSEPFKHGLQAQAQTSCLYDVLNGVVLDAEIQPYSASERALALTHLKKFRENMDEKAIILMDRGYPSFDLMYNIDELKLNYLMRCNKHNFLKEIRDTKTDDEAVCIERNGKELTVRVVTLKINDKDYTFITNLTDKNITATVIAELYTKRWNIETLYKQLKNKMEVENFTGLDELCIKQDFYATMVLLNMAASAIFDSQIKLDKTNAKKELTRTYKINHTYAISELKMRLIKMVYTDSAFVQMREIKYIQRSLLKNIVAYQPERKSKRCVKHPCIKFPVNSKRTLL